MMILIFLLAGSLEQLEIPGYLTKPKLYWADLNGDGKLDIWCRDRMGKTWIWDAASGQTKFEEVPVEKFGQHMQPVKTQEGWVARAYEAGMIFHYNPEQGWLPHTVYDSNARIRKGMKPIQRAGFTLVPISTGYMTLQNGCRLDDFIATPAMALDEKRLKLFWSIPYERDVNRDGTPDLMTPPLRFAQNGEIRIRVGLVKEKDLENQEARLQFPEGFNPGRHQIGDMDGDGFDELVVLASPAQDMSIFDEMSFVVYTGTGIGEWEPVPAQVLETKQNLWQTGPIEMDRQGILLYYFKGLIRSHFKMDRYVWDKNGFIKPKPVSAKWTLPEGDRDQIGLDFDLNGDGLTDLILRDETGTHVHYRKKGDHAHPFNESPDRYLKVGKPQSTGVSITIGNEVTFETNRALAYNRLSGDGSVALVQGGPDQAPQIWGLHMEDSGFWTLHRLE